MLSGWRHIQCGFVVEASGRKRRGVRNEGGNLEVINRTITVRLYVRLDICASPTMLPHVTLCDG